MAPALCWRTFRWPYLPTVPLSVAIDFERLPRSHLFALSEHQSGRCTSGVYAPCRCGQFTSQRHMLNFLSHFFMPRALTCSPADAAGRKSMKAQSNKVEAYCNREENSYRWPLEMHRLKLDWQLPRARMGNWRERSSTYRAGKSH